MALNDLCHWTELAGVEKTFEGLNTLMIRQQYLQTCTKDLELFLRERVVTDLVELARLAEQYIDAHRAVEQRPFDSTNRKRNRNLPPGHLTKKCHS